MMSHIYTIITSENTPFLVKTLSMLQKIVLLNKKHTIFSKFWSSLIQAGQHFKDHTVYLLRVYKISEVYYETGEGLHGDGGKISMHAIVFFFFFNPS